MFIQRDPSADLVMTMRDLISACITAEFAYYKLYIYYLYIYGVGVCLLYVYMFSFSLFVLFCLFISKSDSL